MVRLDGGVPPRSCMSAAAKLSGCDSAYQTERDWPNLRADVQPVVRSELAARLVLRTEQLRATELLSTRNALGKQIGQAMLHRVVHQLTYAVRTEPTVQHLLQSQASPARNRKLAPQRHCEVVVSALVHQPE